MDSGIRRKDDDSGLRRKDDNVTVTLNRRQPE